MAATPTARSLAYARKLGMTADVVERRLPRCFITRDLFNAFDIVALQPGMSGVIGIQTTSGSNAAARMKKLKANPTVRLWIETGNRAEVWSWRKAKNRWVCRTQSLALSDMIENTKET